MSSVSAHYQFNNIAPNYLWTWLESQPSLILPASIENISFSHYHETTGMRYGFQISPPWDVLPNGPWHVLLERLEHNPAEHARFKLTVDREEGLLYIGELDIQLTENDSATLAEINLSGERQMGLSQFSDEFIETILRSTIREGWETIDAKIGLGQDDSTLLVPAITEEEPDHMAPLAVAAGVFSAGMALSLWMWRRKKHKDSA